MVDIVTQIKTYVINATVPVIGSISSSIAENIINVTMLQKGSNGLDGEGYATFFIRAEENGNANGAQNSGFQYSYGNGTEPSTAGGVVIPVDGAKLVELTLWTHGAVTMEVEVYKNGLSTGKTITLTGANSGTQEVEGLTFNKGDKLIFKTLSGSGGTSLTVGAYFVVNTTTAITVVNDDTLGGGSPSTVNAPSISSVKTYTDAGLAGKVWTTGDESIGGIKTFTAGELIVSSLSNPRIIVTDGTNDIKTALATASNAYFAGTASGDGVVRAEQGDLWLWTRGASKSIMFYTQGVGGAVMQLDTNGKLSLIGASRILEVGTNDGSTHKIRFGIGSDAVTLKRVTNSLLLDTYDALYLSRRGTNHLTINTSGEVVLTSWTGVNEFSIDTTLAGDSDSAVPTEKAVKAYIDAHITATSGVLHCAKTGTQNIGGANNTIQYITWESEIKKDTGFIHSTVTNSQRLEVPATGRYSLNAVVAGTVGGSARFAVDLFYRINGSTVVTRGKRGYYSRGSPYNAQVRAPISTELDLTIGDYIEIGTKVQDADGTYTVNTINADCEVILRRMS